MSDVEHFIFNLGSGKEPIQKLRRFVRAVEKQKDTALATSTDRALDKKAQGEPSPLEVFLAQELRSAGIFSLPANMPPLQATVLAKSHSAYIAMFDPLVTWEAKIAVFRIETALRRTLFAERAQQEGYLAYDARVDDFYLFNSRLEQNIASQLLDLNEQGIHDPIRKEKTQHFQGEWDIRQALANGLEEFSLPYRFSGDFRLNAKAGVLALEIEATPPEAIATWVWDESTGRARKRTIKEKERFATQYLAQEVLMGARMAATLSSEIDEVWIRAIHSDAKIHLCLLSAKCKADALRGIKISDFSSPLARLKALGSHFDLAEEVFAPIKPTFSLNDEILAPEKRKIAPELSLEPLKQKEAQALGAATAKDLSINESSERSQIAEIIGRHLSSSTEKNVAYIMEATQANNNEEIRKAGRTIAQQLIDGTLSDTDWETLAREFSAGDALSKALSQLTEDRKTKPPLETLGKIQAELAKLEEAHHYEDDEKHIWRFFSSYAERVLFNRLMAPTSSLELTPRTYYEAQLFCASTLLQTGDAEHALLFAQRACDLNPFGSTAHLLSSKAYEQLGDIAMAASPMHALLEYAHRPESIALAYYRLAYLVWQEEDIRLADALYRKALMRPSPISTMAQLERMTLHAQHAETDYVTNSEIEAYLKQRAIPLAPTSAVQTVLMEAAKAAVDAELFVPAADMCALISLLSQDDALADVAKSIAHEVQ